MLSSSIPRLFLAIGLGSAFNVWFCSGVHKLPDSVVWRRGWLNQIQISVGDSRLERLNLELVARNSQLSRLCLEPLLQFYRVIFFTKTTTNRAMVKLPVKASTAAMALEKPMGVKSP